MKFSMEAQTGNSTPNDRITQINNRIILLLEMSSLARFKNVEMSKTFSEEFFKGVSAIVSEKE